MATTTEYCTARPDEWSQQTARARACVWGWTRERARRKKPVNVVGRALSRGEGVGRRQGYDAVAYKGRPGHASLEGPNCV